jgi:hypothetical protein
MITNEQTAWLALCAAIIILPGIVAPRDGCVGPGSRSYLLLWLVWLVGEAAWRLSVGSLPPELARIFSRITTLSAALIIISGVWPDSLAGTRRIASRIKALWTTYRQRD